MLSPCVSSPHTTLAVSPVPSTEKMTFERLIANDDLRDLFVAASNPASVAVLCGVSRNLHETFAQPQLWASQLVARFHVAANDAEKISDPRREFARRKVVASIEEHRRTSSPPRHPPTPPVIAATPPLPRWAQRLAASGSPVTRSWSPEESPSDDKENRAPHRRPLRSLGQRTGDSEASSRASAASTRLNAHSRSCAISRLRASMRQLVMGECGDAVTACPEQPEDWSVWTAGVTCPRDGALISGMTFQLKLTYPMGDDVAADVGDDALPRVQVLTPCRFYHPNVHPLTGALDIRALGTRCTSVSLVGTQLHAILSLLTRPCFSVAALNREAAASWYGDRAKLKSHMRGSAALAYERAEAEQRAPTSIRRVVSLGL